MNNGLIKNEVSRIIEVLEKEAKNNCFKGLSMQLIGLSKREKVSVLRILQYLGIEVREDKNLILIDLAQTMKPTMEFDLDYELRRFANSQPDVEEIRQNSNKYMEQVINRHVAHIIMEIHNYELLGKHEATFKKSEYLSKKLRDGIVNQLSDYYDVTLEGIEIHVTF